LRNDHGKKRAARDPARDANARAPQQSRSMGLDAGEKRGAFEASSPSTEETRREDRAGFFVVDKLGATLRDLPPEKPPDLVRETGAFPLFELESGAFEAGVRHATKNAEQPPWLGRFLRAPLRAALLRGFFRRRFASRFAGSLARGFLGRFSLRRFAFHRHVSYLRIMDVNGT
jgi:hypothetical protein